jgi:quercetin dioxygenase-like cupin family protein
MIFGLWALDDLTIIMADPPTAIPPSLTLPSLLGKIPATTWRFRMSLDDIKASIVTNVYHITADKKVALHKHSDKDEVFYCLAGAGFGVLEHGEEELAVGKTFIVKAGTMHALRTDADLYVASFLLPTVNEAEL